MDVGGRGDRSRRGDLRRVRRLPPGDERFRSRADRGGVAPVDQDQPADARVDQHVLLEHRGVHDARAVRPAQAGEQPPPDPDQIRRVQVRRFGKAAESLLSFHHIRRTAVVVERVLELGCVGAVVRVAVRAQPPQGGGLGGHQVVVGPAADDLDEQGTVLEEVRQITTEIRRALVALVVKRVQPGERLGGQASPLVPGDIRVDDPGKDPVGLPFDPDPGLVDQLGERARRRDPRGHLVERPGEPRVHRTLSSLVGRSSAGCSSRASPAR